MSSFEGLPQTQAITGDMDPELHTRVAEATPVSVLSPRGDKLLQVVEGADGQKFVTRSYTPEAVRWMEVDDPGISADFPRVWDAMRTTLSRAKVPVVPSVLLEDVNGYPFVIASDYIEDDVPVIEAATDVKKEMAAGLGRLVTADNGRGLIRLTLSPDMVEEKMFMVASNEEGGLAVATLTDVDPLVQAKEDWRTDAKQSTFINRVSDYLWSNWCTEEERAEVIGVFLANLDYSVINNFGLTSDTMAAWARAHRRGQGRDPREEGMIAGEALPGGADGEPDYSPNGHSGA